MEAQTEAHLRLAAANANLAATLAASPEDTHAHVWAAIVAFYAAVHQVNAYLWERRRYEPQNHKERTDAVRFTNILKRAAFSYRSLSTIAYSVRYDPLYTAPSTLSADALRYMRDVGRVIRVALPPPT